MTTWILNHIPKWKGISTRNQWRPEGETVASFSSISIIKPTVKILSVDKKSKLIWITEITSITWKQHSYEDLQDQTFTPGHDFVCGGLRQERKDALILLQVWIKGGCLCLLQDIEVPCFALAQCERPRGQLHVDPEQCSQPTRYRFADLGKQISVLSPVRIWTR